MIEHDALVRAINVKLGDIAEILLSCPEHCATRSPLVHPQCGRCRRFTRALTRLCDYWTAQAAAVPA